MNNKLNKKITKLINNTKAQKLSSNTLYKGKFINVIEEKYLLPNKKIIIREKTIKNNGKEGVLIIAITKNKKIILVVQNRISDITSIEFPAGYIEPNENVLEASIRELKEETGYISNDIKFLDRYYSSIGTDSQIINIVIALNCQKKFNQELGGHEYINYDEFSFNEVKKLIQEGIILGAGSKLAFYENYDLILKKINNN